MILRRTVFVMWLLGLGFTLIATAPVLAVDSCIPGTYNVGDQNANARTGASTDARIAATLSSGSAVQVVGERQGTVVGGSSLWCEISVDGQSLFVHSSSLTGNGGVQPPEQASSNESQAANVSGQPFRVNGPDSVNGRAAPNTGANILAVIPAGTDVLVTGQESGARVNGSDIWYAVSFEGQTVYVHSSLLTATAPVEMPPQGEQAPEQAPTTPLTEPRGNGTYLVNSQIAPGRWESDGTSSRCYWERLDGAGNILGNHFGEAGGTVTILPSDAQVEFSNCGQFRYVETEPIALRTDAHDPKESGFYTIGVEIDTGHWTTTGTGDGCYWERLDANQNIIDNHFGEAGGYIHVWPTDYELHVSDCGTLIYVDGMPRVLQEDAYAPKGDGFYTVGIEIGPGNWTTTGGGNSCYWERLNAFQEIIENHYGAPGDKIFVMETDFEIHVSGCGTLVFEG